MHAAHPSGGLAPTHGPGPRLACSVHAPNVRVLSRAAARYMPERRRRDLVWDNVSSEGEGSWGGSYDAPQDPLTDQNQQQTNSQANATMQPPTRSPAPDDVPNQPPMGNHNGWHSSHAGPGASIEDDGWGVQSGPADWGSTPGTSTDEDTQRWQGDPSFQTWGDPYRPPRHPTADEMDQQGNRFSGSSQSWDDQRPGSPQSTSADDGRGPGRSFRDSFDEEFGGPQGAGPGGRRRAWTAAASAPGGAAGGGQRGRQREKREWQFFAEDARQAGQSWDGQQRTDAPSNPSQPSDVTNLSRTEMEAVLPVTPTGRQAAYFQPRSLSERVVQLMGSVAATMLLSKSTALAAPALLYPLWSPWIRAGIKNVELYSNQLKALGLWRAQVLEVEVLANNTFRPGSWGARTNPIAANAVVRVLMGDPWDGGARVQLEFPYQPKSELLQPGEAVEALVLAKDSNFYAFKVIREVYAPGLGLWLAEYPFVDRTAFLDVSLQVERSRASEPNPADTYVWPDRSDAIYTVDVDISPVGPGDLQGDGMQGSSTTANGWGGSWDAPPGDGVGSEEVHQQRWDYDGTGLHEDDGMGMGGGAGWQAQGLSEDANDGDGGYSTSQQQQPLDGGVGVGGVSKPVDDWDAGWQQVKSNGAQHNSMRQDFAATGAA